VNSDEKKKKAKNGKQQMSYIGTFSVIPREALGSMDDHFQAPLKLRPDTPRRSFSEDWRGNDNTFQYESVRSVAQEAVGCSPNTVHRSLITRKSQAGFTLIELLAALAVFIIGAVAVFPVISQSYRLLQKEDKNLEAAFLAEAVLADVQARGFQSSLPSATGKFDAVPYDFGMNNFSYGLLYRMENDSPDLEADVLQSVDLSISWHVQGKQHVQEYKTYVSRMDPKP